MKKKILGFVVGLSLIGFNLFAADGDLIVNGNLGIGTTSPQYSLDVISSNNGIIRLGNGEGDATTKMGRVVVRHFYNSQLPLYVLGAASTSTSNFVALGGGFTSANAATQIDLYTAPNPATLVGTSRMTITKDGNVGIGATDPLGYKLYVNGTVYSTIGYYASGAEPKENIAPIDSPLNKILSIEGISFTWKTGEEYKDKGFPEGRHYGVVAEEIEKVLPEIVRESPNGEKAVAYAEIIPILIEAMKEQQKAIESLRAELAQMKAK